MIVDGEFTSARAGRSPRQATRSTDPGGPRPAMDVITKPFSLIARRALSAFQGGIDALLVV